MSGRIGNMSMEQVREVPFGELFEEPTRNGLTRPKAVRGVGTKMVNMGELFAFPRIHDAPMDRVPLSDSEEERCLLNNGDLLFARQSLVLEGAGKCSIFLRDNEPVTFESHVTRVRLDSQKASPLFYFYYFQSPHGRAAIRSIVEQGAGASGIRGSDLGRLAVLMLPIETQRTAAEILGTLDDKIELNRKTNETLEAMARALFQSWFVDFDPVRAKAEGRDPGLPTDIAALFPDSFEPSELGPIPKGWRVMGLDEIARFLNGLALQKYPPIDDRSVPVIKIAQLRAGNTIGANRASADLEPEYLVQDGDILFSWSGSLECVFWAGGLGALNQHIFKVTSAKYPRWLCYLAVHQHLDEFRHIAAGKATTMGHIQRRHLSDAKIAVPPIRLLEAMNAVIEPTVESTWRRNVESRNLAALRDTLLPKLISGELRVKTSQSEKSAPAEVCNG
jgi:type I restriction enzyme S subunit